LLTTLQIDFDIEHTFHILAMKAEFTLSLKVDDLLLGLTCISQLILVLVVLLWGRLVVVKFLSRRGA